ncbi:uncharacterized protein LOC135843800 [Planococcus citri]|uniref:uncharacterized protein LOC135843800 n=1 Tax=Planococcus citri TaxID=170843 RepID=UPI0031F7BE86
MAFSSKNVDDFANQIADLETALSNRQLNALEAKIFYDHLTSVYENVKSYETQLKTSSENQSEVPPTCFSTIRDIYLNAIDLKIRLMKVLSSTESTAPASEIINIEETNATKQSETAKNLHSQLRKQSYLIRQMESLETQNDICATKAEILYNHLSQLYDMFISNQIQIEANVDEGDSLQNQQKISKEIQQIVIDLQTKLKKIIKPTESTETKRPASLLIGQRKSLLTNMTTNPASSISSLQMQQVLPSVPSSSPSLVPATPNPPTLLYQQQQLQQLRWQQLQQQTILAQQRLLQNQVGTTNYSLAGLSQQQQNPNSTQPSTN